MREALCGSGVWNGGECEVCSGVWNGVSGSRTALKRARLESSRPTPHTTAACVAASTVAPDSPAADPSLFPSPTSTLLPGLVTSGTELGEWERRTDVW